MCNSTIGFYNSTILQLVMQTCLQVELNFFLQVRNVSGRLFMFSAVKASERAKAPLVSPAKKKVNQVISFWREFLAALTRVLSRACVVESCQSLSKQTNNGTKFR